MTRQPNPQSPPTQSALLHIGAEVAPEVEDEFNRWTEEHVLDNLQLPGYLGVRRFVRNPGHEGMGQSPRYLTLYDLEDESALTPRSNAPRGSGLPERFRDHVTFERAVYREIGTHSGSCPQATGKAILHVTVDVDPAWTEPFLEWYAGVHVPAVLEAPGMIGAQRFENIELEAGKTLPNGLHSYCTLYEMEDAGAISSPEMMEASARGACPAELAPHRVAFNHVYDEFFRAP